jgi:hypothetical protein
LNPKSTGWLALAVLIALGGGWLWGASGKYTVDRERRALEVRVDFSDARAEMLDTRVSLFQQDFGDARRHLDAAQAAVLRVQARFRELQQAERAGRLEVVLAHLRDAERLATALDASAQSAVEQALKGLAAAQQ